MAKKGDRKACARFANQRRNMQTYNTSATTAPKQSLASSTDLLAVEMPESDYDVDENQDDDEEEEVVNADPNFDDIHEAQIIDHLLGVACAFPTTLQPLAADITGGTTTDAFTAEITTSTTADDPFARSVAEIYLYAFKSGVTLDFVDGLFCRVRKYTKEGVIGIVEKAPLRSTFLRNVRLAFGPTAPPLPTSIEVPFGGPTIPKFPLLGQLLDLIASEHFLNSSKLVINADPTTRFQKYVVPHDEQLLEVNSGRWYQETYDQFVHDIENDWLFPLIFYIDKTGTDAMQRFPLEPLMVTTSILTRETRENASAWRHVGFVTPDANASSSAHDNAQIFHRCLDVLLEDLVKLQESPPLVQVKLEDGTCVVKRLILPVAYVIGDALSQDKHCGRMAINAGGAGRIHRQCKCSCFGASCTSKRCVSVTKDEIEQLFSLASMTTEQAKSLVLHLLPQGDVTASTDNQNKLMNHLVRRSAFAVSMLNKVYSMHVIENAWHKISFGANKEGIYRATLDDPMHYAESGAFLYLSQVAFLSMTSSERLEMERIIKSLFQGKRSSVRDDLPRGKFSTGFTRTTLLTAGEKVGLILSLFVALGTTRGAAIYSIVISRLQQKYLKMPIDHVASTTGLSRTPTSYPGHQDATSHLPHRGDSHFFLDFGRNTELLERTISGVKRSIEVLKRHGLSFVVLGKHFDELQTEYLLTTIHKELDSSSLNNHYPAIQDIAGVYYGHGVSLSDPEVACAEALYRTVRKKQPDNEKKRKGVQQAGDKNIRTGGTERTDDLPYKVHKELKKHNLVMPRIKGSGSTSAILTDLEGFRDLLRQALCFHSLVHFFEQLPVGDRINAVLIEGAVSKYVKTYSSVVYRGHDSCDCDIGKIHAHLHLARDIQDFGHPMNWDAGKGERGLKVWAKLAGSRAMKQDLAVFTHQAAIRVAESALLAKACLPPYTEATARSEVGTTQAVLQESINLSGVPKVRKHPHFLFFTGTKRLAVVSRWGEEKLLPDTFKPINERVIKALLSYESGNLTTEYIKIWKNASITMNGANKPIRASSVQDSFGEFFDWVSVQFDPEDDQSCYPAKLLLLYHDRSDVLSAIVHGCNWRTQIQRKKLSTPLTTRWDFEFDTKGNAVLRKIRIDAIVEVLYVVEHEAHLFPNALGMNVPQRVLGSNVKYSIDVIEPRYMWVQQMLDEGR